MSGFQPGARLRPSNVVLERLRAAANIEKASVFRLEPPGPRDAIETSPVDQFMIVGRPIVTGTEATLSPDLVLLLGEWLGNPAGFNSTMVRTCDGGDRYGFRLTRNVPHVGREVTEVAMELRCNTLAIANQEGTLRPEVYSYFDESRAALLTLLRQGVLPSLREALPKR
jgi:hypothetical protein